MFSVPCKISSHTLFDSFELMHHFDGNPGQVCAAHMFLGMCKVLKDLDKIY